MINLIRFLYNYKSIIKSFESLIKMTEAASDIVKRINNQKKVINSFNDYHSLELTLQELKRMKNDFILKWKRIKTK